MFGWGVHEDGRLVMTIPSGKKSRDVKISVLSAKNTCEKLLKEITDTGNQHVTTLTTKLSGNSRRWPETIRVRGRQGADINGYALDTIPIPFSNLGIHGCGRVLLISFLMGVRSLQHTAATFTSFPELTTL